MAKPYKSPVPWESYYEHSKQKPLHPLYDEIDKHLGDGGVALELGCGIGHGVEYLLSKGYHVIANDGEPQAIEILKQRLPGDADVEFSTAPFQDIRLGEYDVVIAAFSLFFLTPDEFGEFWPRLVRSIKPGGLFAGQFLGVHDEWQDYGYTLHTREQVQELLKDFDVLHIEEAERDGETINRQQKHWHVFHVVARKRTV